MLLAANGEAAVVGAPALGKLRLGARDLLLLRVCWGAMETCNRALNMTNKRKGRTPLRASDL